MNNRIYKFRAWDKEAKEMLMPVVFMQRANPKTFERELLPAEVNKRGQVDTVDGYILMQYTNLKDKNGTDICEGDILKHPEFNIAGKVYWDEKDVCFSSNSLPSEWQYEEIIGNIWENANLLDKPSPDQIGGNK